VSFAFTTARVGVVAMSKRLSRLRICSEAGVDGGIVIRLRRVVGVVGGLKRGRLALVGQHVSHHVGALSVSMCPRLKKSS
jgi:hypothetical protein